MPPSSNISSAPGIALTALLHEADPKLLRKLIGTSTMEVLYGLDPNLPSSNHLGELASKFIDPYEVLIDTEKRNLIIQLLPLHKAHELSQRLGVKDDRHIYKNLCRRAMDNTALPELLSFFGVVSDVRAPTGDTVSGANTVEAAYSLFEYQRVAASKVISALSSDPRKVVLHMPTGSGKTRTAMHIVASHLNRDKPTLVCWLAQNAELLDQAADEFENAWQHLGNRPVDIVRFWGHRNPEVMDINDGLIVAGLGKMSAMNNRNLAALPKLADRISLTVMDEAHQAIAPTYQDILTSLYTKRPRNALLGLTATPGRTWSDIAEDQKLSDYFEGQKVTLEFDEYKDPVQFLVNEGYLARATFRTLNSEAGLNLSNNDLQELSASIDVPNTFLKKLGEDTQRNLKIVAAVEELTNRHRRIIIFSPSVDHARMLATILSLRGIQADVVTAQTNTSERERIIRGFRSGAHSTRAIVNYGVLTTGFDAPATSAVVIARPTMSLVLYSQMAGRAIRGPRAGGNKEAEIVTVIDPQLPGFGNIADAFKNWEDVWNEPR